jgi:hypothetical protein
MDGSFGITQKKYTNCEITVELKDAKCLYLIKNKFGGTPPKGGIVFV